MARDVPTLAQLINSLPQHVGALRVTGATDAQRRAASVHITGLAEHSRRVEPGNLFIARPGTHTDGRQFIADAVAAGALAVLTTADAPVDLVGSDIVLLQTDDVPKVAAHLAAQFYGQPAAALSMIGVTGTNGKSTVAHLVRHLLNADTRNECSPCGMIGTVGVDLGPVRANAAGASTRSVGSGPPLSHHRLTTPSSVDLSRLLATMRSNGCRACVMECSSHGLAQDRVAGIAFDVAVFTNLSGDHQDYHADMNEYAAAKAKLFAMLPPDGAAVLNIDDPAAEVMRETATPTGAKVLECSLRNERADWHARVVRQHLTGTDLHITGPGAAWRDAALTLPLLGEHNVMNALQALAVADHLGLDANGLMASLANVTAPPGRFERVTHADCPFTVLVDFAHTDDALDKALAALRPIVPTDGRLCVIFGCGGDKDRTKRPRMVGVALRWADRILVTSDNPRHEDPDSIISDIMTGVEPGRADDVIPIVDRRAAIDRAIQEARPGDLILIAGKGDETEQVIGDDARPFDDRVVAREALARLAATHPTHVETAT